MKSRLSAPERAACPGVLLLLFVLAACAQSLPTPAPAAPPTVQPKLLATVFISPTPDLAQRQATLAANPPTPTPVPVIGESPTAYVGVFIGEAEAQPEGPVINPALINNPPTPLVPPTQIAGCPASADPLFGDRWTRDMIVAERLGCPIELVGAFTGLLQIFERGAMYARQNGEIWALVPAQGRFWYYPVALPPPPGDVIVPEGLLAPSPTFYTIWRSVQGLSDQLGFARTTEQPASIALQKFQGGSLFADGSSGQVFVLLADGRLFGPY